MNFSQSFPPLGLALVALSIGCVGAHPKTEATLMNQEKTTMNGYAYGHKSLATSPVSLEELDLLKQSLLMGPDDIQALRMSLELLKPQTEDILDVWYGFVASTPQLLKYFSNAKTGEPDGDYLGAVRKRFGQWILDTARAEYDQDWLNYQYEIGLRHHTTKKNKTDGAESVPIIHFRYIAALVYPVTATLKPFLEMGEHTPEEVEGMQQAWVKSVLLQAILWSYPFVNEGEF